MSERHLLDTNEAAEFLRVSPGYLRHLRFVKRGPAFYSCGLGSRRVVRYTVEGLLAWCKYVDPVDADAAVNNERAAA